MRLPRSTFAASAALTTVLLTAACGGAADEATDDVSGSSNASSSAPADAGDSASTGGEYADGTYEASGSYSNPGGTSEVDVSITLTDGTVSAVEVTPKASGTSRQYQEKFAGGIASEVEGKSLDELDVSKVSGSSLTSGGFNTALEQIKSEAQA